ncbi:MAG: YbaK/EbsC family protein [Inquilinus sp.]|nr:YbaK/EbsC family protein [Inquilinus sp.]
MAKTGAGITRFQEALAELDEADRRIVTFDESTRTAADAAAAIGCTVAQIAKSLVFRTAESGRPVLVVASGANRVDEAKLQRVLAPRLGHEKIARADAGFVREKTGYAIGGVAPIGHAVPPTVVIDAELFIHATIWAAAGAPNAVFELTPDALERLTGGILADIAVPAG